MGSNLRRRGGVWWFRRLASFLFNGTAPGLAFTLPDEQRRVIAGNLATITDRIDADASAISAIGIPAPRSRVVRGRSENRPPARAILVAR
jgi:hypothetical protein